MQDNQRQATQIAATLKNYQARIEGIRGLSGNTTS